MLDYKRAQFVCLSAKLEVIRRSDEEKSSRKRITIKEKEMREHNRGREWVAKRERENTTQGENEWQRGRRMCRKTNCRICFYRTIFLTGKSTHQFYRGRPLKKKQEVSLQIVFKLAFGQLLMCHIFFICESYRLDELIRVYLFWWLDRTILSIEIRHSRALRHKFDKKPNQSKNESHKYY